MKRMDFTRYAPPGMELRLMRNYWITSTCLGFLSSVWLYFSSLEDYVRMAKGLYTPVYGAEFAGVPDFVDVLGSSLIFFPLFALGSLFFIVYHYSYHFRGSKSIYLMRRLPDRWELHRRCLTLPIAMAVFFLLLGFIMLLLFFWAYFAAVPAQYIQPDQWAKIWR